MNTALHEDQMRVTSIPYRSTKMVIFSGVRGFANIPSKLTLGDI